MKYRKVSRGRRMSTWKGNRNGSGNSKFKTRHRKMRGGVGVGSVGVDGIQLYDCSVPESHVGGPDYNQPDYDMHASENTNPSPNTPSIKEHNGTTVNTVFTGNTMKMGLFNRRSFFTSGPKHLHKLGLIQVITDNENCNISAQCSPIFYKNDTGVIHSKTKYVFFGQLDAKGNKHGWGICYDVSTPTAGRIFIGYWKDGKMYGLGIEVDFNYDTANNTHEPVGIYYGHFSQGKRHSYGIYYDITVDHNGKKTLFHTQRDGKMCMLLDKSFVNLTPKEKTRHENKFTTMCISSLSFNSILQGIDEYTDFCFKQLNLAIGITSTLVKREHGDKEYHIFQGYVKEYQKFVKICRGVLDDALTKYEAQKNKDTIEAGKKKKEKDEKLKIAQDLLNENYFTGFTGKIVDPDEKVAQDAKIVECKNFLTELDYKIQTPDEIREKEEEEKEKKLAQHAQLTQANSDLEKIKNELAIMQQAPDFLKTMNPGIGQNFYSSLSRSNRGRRSLRSHFNSSSSSRSSDSPRTRRSVSPLLIQTLSRAGTPGRTPAGTGTPGTAVTPGGGGNLTRKNMRTNKRKKTRKFRKSRRGGRR